MSLLYVQLPLSYIIFCLECFLNKIVYLYMLDYAPCSISLHVLHIFYTFLRHAQVHFWNTFLVNIHFNVESSVTFDSIKEFNIARVVKWYKDFISRYFRRLSVVCYLFSTFINHAIRNTELRLILLSIACGQVAFRQSILSAHQVLAWCMMYYPPPSVCFFECFSLCPSLLNATKTMQRDAFWDKLFGRQETAHWRARPYFPVDRLCNFDRWHAKRSCLDATTMRPRSS